MLVSCRRPARVRRQRWLETAARPSEERATERLERPEEPKQACPNRFCSIGSRKSIGSAGQVAQVAHQGRPSKPKLRSRHARWRLACEPWRLRPGHVVPLLGGVAVLSPSPPRMPSPPRTCRHHRTAIAHHIGHNRRRRTCDRKCDFNGGIVTSAKDLAPQAWTERLVRYERALNARAGHSARPRRLIWAFENSGPAGAARARSQRRGSGRRCGWRAARRVGARVVGVAAAPGWRQRRWPTSERPWP